jgi:hypothetical protein
MADVVLVERKNAFVHNVATLSALVAPSRRLSVYLPHQRLLARGRVVRAARPRAGRARP